MYQCYGVCRWHGQIAFFQIDKFFYLAKIFLYRCLICFLPKCHLALITYLAEKKFLISCLDCLSIGRSINYSEMETCVVGKKALTASVDTVGGKIYVSLIAVFGRLQANIFNDVCKQYCGNPVKQVAKRDHFYRYQKITREIRTQSLVDDAQV